MADNGIPPGEGENSGRRETGPAGAGDPRGPRAEGVSGEGRGARAEADRPIFEALLVPYRSLGRTGFTILMSFFCLVSIVTGALFLANGAWPVVGFFGLDVALVWWAFAANYRAAKAREEVVVSRTDCAIRKISPKGVVREAHHNPFWARFKVSRHEEIGITRMSVDSREASTEIGSFLNPDDRESFATAFNRALLTAKGR
ncbi:DUF2244 domain-containing protein [Aurantimonas sp. VKM B-3413]|uniref:DUF2244 domain-containing protein n=1 Tax=Aurantimonas sp. VKM B-3413 TaxID=2779401 RepID=UPI001E2BB3D7|nr:DUF2244 domain-containing protein [Aurantimonas sp. VKM B-3413]MCB8838038.1 DUF2244 domain-containing protein [Aurantimonas sp. VKM B-3413]